MKTEILDLGLIDKTLIPAKSQLSFQPFVAYLESLIKDQPLKEALFKNMIDKFKNDLSGREFVRIDEAAEFEELLELIYMFLNPLVYNSAKHVWALSTPVPGEIFFSTDAFYNFHTRENYNPLAGDFATKNILSGKEKGFIYQLILRRFYNIDFSVSSDSHIQGLNPKTRTPVYYKIQIDSRFLDITYTGDLPDLDIELIESWLVDSKGEKYLETLLPLSNFQIKGFSILQFTDVTEEHALENLKNIIVNYDEVVFNESLNETLQSLAGKRNLRFGILPFIKLNKRTVYLSQASTNSIIMNAAVRYKVSQDIYHEFVEQYEESQDVIVHNNISTNKFEKEPLLKMLRYAGIESFAVLPVVYLKKVVGILEVYSNERVFIDQALLSRLQAAVPYIVQLFKHISDNFDASIEQAVRNNFTSIKSSVKWKFNEVVWTYLKESRDIATAEIGKITFDKLYPFYGAVDVRQSTLERNNAVFTDINLHIELLEQVLNDLPAVLTEAFTDILLLNKKRWLEHFQAYKEKGDEITFNNLIQEEIEPFLFQAAETSEKVRDVIKPYFNSVSESQGSFHKNRRELERSMQIINENINKYLISHLQELQKIFPLYFEKFRTDGVEYDIYLGQSIAPYKIFNMEHVRHMRLWQLKSMAEIARITRNLKPELSKPLQTTQLIFIHSAPISISFRNDEKRFDVDGAFSVRYEMVKKRIDKVLIKGTNERLTQPEKVSMVYYTKSEEEEYLEYIGGLQREGYFSADLELLELEDLQGVHGLKAIRVGVS
ncbi:GAF domain-containing protein [Daejeonella sp.]|uniref:GAF domain-containing protein n=1 Tax=Daejeonella sp. TaxID=2805397 RepID=UPI0030BA83ED